MLFSLILLNNINNGLMLLSNVYDSLITSLNIDNNWFILFNASNL